MTTPDQLRAIVDYLQNRVRLAAEEERNIVFNPPTIDEMIAAGLDEATAGRLLAASWWPELVDDVRETPEFAEPEAPPTVVLGYARDVIREFVGKRLVLEV